MEQGKKHPKFSKKHLECLEFISPGISGKIKKFQQEKSMEDVARQLELRKSKRSEFDKLRKKLDKDYMVWVKKTERISDELERYDGLTPHYLGILDKMNNFSQAIIYYFGEFPVSLSSKEITCLVDSDKTSSYISSYLTKLIKDGVLEKHEKRYSIKDEHLQNFLVMRYNRQLLRGIQNASIERDKTCISSFIAENVENFKRTLEKRVH